MSMWGAAERADHSAGCARMRDAAAQRTRRESGARLSTPAKCVPSDLNVKPYQYIPARSVCLGALVSLLRRPLVTVIKPHQTRPVRPNPQFTPSQPGLCAVSRRYRCVYSQRATQQRARRASQALLFQLGPSCAAAAARAALYQPLPAGSAGHPPHEEIA
jgi:hypothetical protein